MNKLYFSVSVIVIASIISISCNTKDGQQQKLEMNELNFITKECDKEKLFDKYIFSLNKKDTHEIMKTFKTSYTNEVWRVISFYKNHELVEDLSENLIDDEVLNNEFNNIFSKEFIICISKIDFEELFKNGKFITKNFGVEQNVDCRVISTYDGSDEVSIVLSYDFYENGEKYESSINYIYALEDCTLKMKSILLIN